MPDKSDTRLFRRQSGYHARPASSVSAEHGIGLHKKRYLPIARNPEEIQLMITLKKTLDPKNILNRGKVLDV